VCGRQYYNYVKMSFAKHLEIWTIITFSENIGKTQQIPTKNLKGQAGQVQCQEGWLLNGTNTLYFRRERESR
jgi:hypothetical protein